jgi:hypothetical protein
MAVPATSQEDTALPLEEFLACWDARVAASTGCR